MTTRWVESGTSATYGLDFFSQTSGTLASGTGCANFIQRALKTSASVFGYVIPFSLGTGGTNLTGCLSFRVAGPDANSNQIANPSSTMTIMRMGNVAGQTEFMLTLSTSGVLAIYNGTTMVSGSAVITGKTTPQRVCVVWNTVTTTNFTIKLFVNGVLDATATGADFTLSLGGTSYRIGADGIYLVRDTYWWDFYHSDDGSLTDPGDIRVTAKLPSKLNTNNFDTLGGSGTNRYDRVGERPLSLTNYIQHAATSDVQENFAIQGELEGDDNLCGAQIIARAAWAVVKRSLSASAVTGHGADNKTAGTTLVSTVTEPMTSVEVGCTCLIAFAMDGATGTVSCTDNASTPNTYVVDVDRAAASPSTSNVRVCIIRGYIANKTNLTTITITHPSVTARGCHIGWFAGIDQSSPLDKTASAVGTTANPSSGSTATTAQNNELIFGALASEDQQTGYPTGRGGMTPAAQQVYTGANTGTTGSGAASNCNAYATYAFQTSATTQAASWTDAATDWCAAVATYKCAAEGGGTPKLMNNGTEGSTPMLTTAAAAYMNIVDGGGYPNNPAAVGMRSSNAFPDTFMYECGMLIAYIPGPPTHHHHKWGPTFSPVLAQ